MSTTANKKRSKKLVEKVENKSVDYDDDQFLKEWGFKDNFCHHCGKKNSEISGLLMQCGRCKSAYYCSRQCFNDSLPIHSKMCETIEKISRDPSLSGTILPYIPLSGRPAKTWDDDEKSKKKGQSSEDDEPSSIEKKKADFVTLDKTKPEKGGKKAKESKKTKSQKDESEDVFKPINEDSTNECKSPKKSKKEKKGKKDEEKTSKKSRNNSFEKKNDEDPDDENKSKSLSRSKSFKVKGSKKDKDSRRKKDDPNTIETEKKNESDKNMNNVEDNNPANVLPIGTPELEHEHCKEEDNSSTASAESNKNHHDVDLGLNIDDLHKSDSTVEKDVESNKNENDNVSKFHDNHEIEASTTKLRDANSRDSSHPDELREVSKIDDAKRDFNLARKASLQPIDRTARGSHESTTQGNENEMIKKYSEIIPDNCKHNSAQSTDDSRDESKESSYPTIGYERESKSNDDAERGFPQIVPSEGQSTSTDYEKESVELRKVEESKNVIASDEPEMTSIQNSLQETNNNSLSSGNHDSLLFPCEDESIELDQGNNPRMYEGNSIPQITFQRQKDGESKSETNRLLRGSNPGRLPLLQNNDNEAINLRSVETDSNIEPLSMDDNTQPTIENDACHEVGSVPEEEKLDEADSSSCPGLKETEGSNSDENESKQEVTDDLYGEADDDTEIFNQNEQSINRNEDEADVRNIHFWKPTRRASIGHQSNATFLRETETNSNIHGWEKPGWVFQPNLVSKGVDTSIESHINTDKKVDSLIHLHQVLEVAHEKTQPISEDQDQQECPVSEPENSQEICSTSVPSELAAEDHESDSKSMKIYDGDNEDIRSEKKRWSEQDPGEANILVDASSRNEIQGEQPNNNNSPNRRRISPNKAGRRTSIEFHSQPVSLKKSEITTKTYEWSKPEWASKRSVIADESSIDNFGNQEQLPEGESLQHSNELAETDADADSDSEDAALMNSKVNLPGKLKADKLKAYGGDEHKIQCQPKSYARTRGNPIATNPLDGKLGRGGLKSLSMNAESDECDINTEQFDGCSNADSNYPVEDDSFTRQEHSKNNESVPASTAKKIGKMERRRSIDYDPKKEALRKTELEKKKYEWTKPEWASKRNVTERTRIAGDDQDNTTIKNKEETILDKSGINEHHSDNIKHDDCSDSEEPDFGAAESLNEDRQSDSNNQGEHSSDQKPRNTRKVEGPTTGYIKTIGKMERRRSIENDPKKVLLRKSEPETKKYEWTKPEWASKRNVAENERCIEDNPTSGLQSEDGRTILDKSTYDDLQRQMVKNEDCSDSGDHDFNAKAFEESRNRIEEDSCQKSRNSNIDVAPTAGFVKKIGRMERRRSIDNDPKQVFLRESEHEKKKYEWTKPEWASKRNLSDANHAESKSTYQIGTDLSPSKAMLQTDDDSESECSLDTSFAKQLMEPKQKIVPGKLSLEKLESFDNSKKEYEWEKPEWVVNRSLRGSQHQSKKEYEWEKPEWVEKASLHKRSGTESSHNRNLDRKNIMPSSGRRSSFVEGTPYLNPLARSKQDSEDDETSTNDESLFGDQSVENSNHTSREGKLESSFNSETEYSSNSRNFDVSSGSLNQSKTGFGVRLKETPPPIKPAHLWEKPEWTDIACNLMSAYTTSEVEEENEMVLNIGSQSPQKHVVPLDQQSRTDSVGSSRSKQGNNNNDSNTQPNDSRSVGKNNANTQPSDSVSLGGSVHSARSSYSYTPSYDGNGDRSLQRQRSSRSIHLREVQQPVVAEKEIGWQQKPEWTNTKLLRPTKEGEVLKTKGDLVLPSEPKAILETGKVKWEKPKWMEETPILKKLNSIGDQ